MEEITKELLWEKYQEFIAYQNKWHRKFLSGIMWGMEHVSKEPDISLKKFGKWLNEKEKL